MNKAEVAALICDLPLKDRLIYGAINRAAQEGKPCPTADDLVEVSGYSAVSSTVEAIQRLERPLNLAPHWRDRPREIPAPSPVIVKARDVDVSVEIMKWAAGRGVSFSEALADLVFVGWKVEMERG